MSAKDDYKPGWRIWLEASLAITELSDEDFAQADRDTLNRELLVQQQARLGEIVPADHEREVVIAALEAEIRITKQPGICIAPLAVNSSCNGSGLKSS